MSSPNPFSTPNPFADPSVTAHTESADNDSNAYGVAPAGTGAWGGSQGAWGTPVNTTLGAANDFVGNGKKPTATELELSHREEEIRQREKMLEARQNELRNLQRTATSGPTTPIKNWPPCSPILYHDISAEIPASLQTTVWRAYYSYLLFCATLLYNFLSITLAFSEDVDILSWIFAGIYIVTGVPGAFLLWYGRLYNAASYDRAVTFMCYFIGYTVHIAFCVWAAIPVPLSVGNAGSSFTGLIEVFKKFDKAAWLGVIYLIGFILWVGNVLVSIYIWQNAMRDFRGRGGPQQVQSQAQAAAGRAVLTSATGGRI